MPNNKNISSLVLNLHVTVNATSILIEFEWVQGAKAAAVRKLQHELGIKKGSLAPEQFKFLTRLHYCAADTITYGDQAEWGEHEMDYILVARADVDVHPNPEEVQVSTEA